jgi:hypothetical protein
MWLESGDDRMAGLLKLTDGRQYRGIVHVNSVLRTQNDIADYLLQVNSAAAFPVAGDATVYAGKKFLLGTGVTEFNGGPLFRSLRMITVDQELAWTRASASTDTLTGLPKASSQPSQGTALCCVQATSKISDVFRINTSKFALITNSAVHVDDRLGNFVVVFVETRHGLQYAEVR